MTMVLNIRFIINNLNIKLSYERKFFTSVNKPLEKGFVGQNFFVIFIFVIFLLYSGTNLLK